MPAESSKSRSRQERVSLACFLFLAVLAGAAHATGQPEISAAVNREQVPPNGRIHFWISVKNTGGQDLHQVRFLSFDGPELAQTGPCWKKGVPVCVLRSDGGQIVQAAADLPPGGVVTFMADMLPAGDAAGKVSLTGVLGWESEGRQQSAFITAGPVELVDRWGAWRWVYELSKDLALPLVVLFMGWYFKVSELRRAQVQQTWSQMLQKSHENAEKYYMPLSSALLRIRVDSDPARATPESQLLGDVLMILRRQHEMARMIGGWYFKNREGEETIATTWRTFYLIAEKWFAREDIEHLVARLDPQDRVAQILDKLQREPSLSSIQARLEQSFRQWRATPQDFEISLALLWIVEMLLDFEMNRPYEVWYGRKERFDLDSFGKPLEKLQVRQAQMAVADPMKERLSDLCAVLKRYKSKARLHNFRVWATQW